MGGRSGGPEQYVQAAQERRREGRRAGGVAGTEMGDGTERLGRAGRRRAEGWAGKQGQARADARGLSPSGRPCTFPLARARFVLFLLLWPLISSPSSLAPALAICSCSRTAAALVRWEQLRSRPITPFARYSRSALHLATELQPSSCVPSRVSTSVRSRSCSPHPASPLGDAPSAQTPP